MFEHDISSDWSEATPGKVEDSSEISTESARWTRLIQRPIFMTTDLLKYGPLTVDGYLRARRDTTRRENSQQRANWPVEPSAIARVLAVCGVDDIDAAYASIEHAEHMPSNEMAFASALLVHLDVLKHLGIPPSPAQLLEALHDVHWGSTESSEFKETFKIFSQYVVEAEMDAFLTAWLPELKAGQASYGGDSLGIAIAQAFPDCDPTPLRNWCRVNDDQQGLGYMVWQGRVAFKDWLAEVANPARGAADRSSNSTKNNIQLRHREQVATFDQLLSKIPVCLLQDQYQCLLSEDPTVLDELLERTYSEPHSTLSIAWIACLTRIVALSENHPSMLSWLDRAHKAQTSIIDAGNKSERNMGSSFYGELRTTFESFGSSTRDLLARHMAMNMSPDNYQSEDINWLTVSSIGSILCAKPAGSPRYVHPSSLALFPFLCATDKSMVGKRIMERVILGESSAFEVIKALKRTPSTAFDDVEIISGDEVLSLLRAITNSDTTPIRQMISALGVSTTDPLFYSAVEGALEAAFGTSNMALPEIHMPDDPGY